MKERKLHSTIPEKQALENFSVPEGYFEQNAVQLKQIAKEHPQEKAKVFHLKPMLTWMSTAAAVALVVFGVVNWNQTQVNTDAYLTEYDVYKLVEEGEVVFDDYELAYALEIETIDWALADDLPTTAEEEEPPYYLEEYLLNY
jgi:hypothetical protein